MKKYLQVILALTVVIPYLANASGPDVFVQAYFKAWNASQSPGATADDLNTYLSLLTDDVGHQHLPYDPNGSRDVNNKEKMKEGMTFYLGAHVKHKATLTDVVHGHNVVVLKYATESEGVHPQTGESIKQSYDTVEVLEFEEGKVSVIRKYSE